MKQVTDPLLLQALRDSPGTPLQPAGDQEQPGQSWGAWLADALMPRQTALTTSDVLNSPVGGAIRGARDVVDQGAALAARGLQAMAPEALQPFAKQQVADVAAANKAGEEDYAQNWRQGQPPSFDVGRLAGNIGLTGALTAGMPGVGAASLLPRIGAGVAGGAVGGALTPVQADSPDFWSDVGQNMALGGAIGGATPLVTGSIARAIRPNTSPEAQLLMDAGVNPTPGQMLGGTASRIEQGLTSIPGPGDVLKNAQRATMTEYNRGAINRVLGHIGEELEAPGMSRETINEMQTKVRDFYNAAVPNAGARFDQQAVTDFANLRRLSQLMPADRARQFDEHLRQYVFDRVSPNGSLTGEAFKNAESDLGNAARDFLRSPVDSDARALGNALREAQSTLRNLLARANPPAANELNRANRAYAEMLRVENASGRSGAEPGLFSPAQLQAAAKKYSSQSQYASGRALMQDYADAGRSVLGATVPDSGTPYRGMLAALTAAGGTAAGVPGSLQMLAALLGSTGVAVPLYSPFGRWAASRAMSSRPAGAEAVADAVRRLPGGALVPGLLGQ